MKSKKFKIACHQVLSNLGDGVMSMYDPPYTLSGNYKDRFEIIEGDKIKIKDTLEDAAAVFTVEVLNNSGQVVKVVTVKIDGPAPRLDMKPVSGTSLERDSVDKPKNNDEIVDVIGGSENTANYALEDDHGGKFELNDAGKIVVKKTLPNLDASYTLRVKDIRINDKYFSFTR